MTTTIDAALRDALREVNAAYTRLPVHLRERFDVDVPGADEAVNTAIRSGDQTAALAAIDRWRTAHLAQIAEAGRSTMCACKSPLVMADEYDEARCIRCGRGERT